MATFISYFVFKKDTRYSELAEIKLQSLGLDPAKRKLLYLKIRLLIILAMLSCLSSSENEFKIFCFYLKTNWFSAYH